MRLLLTQNCDGWTSDCGAHRSGARDQGRAAVELSARADAERRRLPPVSPWVVEYSAGGRWGGCRPIGGRWGGRHPIWGRSAHSRLTPTKGQERRTGLIQGCSGKPEATGSDQTVRGCKAWGRWTKRVQGHRTGTTSVKWVEDSRDQAETKWESADGTRMRQPDFAAFAI